jgi:tRNA (guanine-N7-)-methyltransferase
MRMDPAAFSSPPPTWQKIFGNTNPVEVEIGFGKGAFLLALARNHPECNFFGVEFTKHWAFRLSSLLERDGPSNTIVVHADFTCLVETMIWPDSVSAYHLYFPDPWWKRRHSHRRLFHPYRLGFATALVRTLKPQGKIFLASDVREYFEQIVQQFSLFPPLQQFPWERDQVTKKGKLITTDFEQKYRKEERAIFYAGFEKS